LERGANAVAVASDQLVEPGLPDAVAGEDLSEWAILDHERGDHQGAFDIAEA
jgi:hypothetical protein